MVMCVQDGKNNNTFSVVVEVRDLQDTPPRWIRLPAKTTVQDGYTVVSSPPKHLGK